MSTNLKIIDGAALNEGDSESAVESTAQFKPIVDPYNDFVSCDNIVRKGSEYYRHVGQALKAIKIKKLWKKSFSSWTGYCKDRGISTVQANRLIRASAIDQQIRSAAAESPGKVQRLPCSEWQIRPLTKSMSDDDFLKSWILAIKLAGGKAPSQRNVRDAVKQILGDDSSPTIIRKRILWKLLRQLEVSVLKMEKKIIPLKDVLAGIKSIREAI